MLAGIVTLRIACFATLLTACGASPVVSNDGGRDVSADAAPATCALRFDDPDTTPFGASEHRAFAVSVSAAPPGTTVRFALVGDGRDASLRDTTLLLDASGVAETVLTAPSRHATFRLRASASCGGEAVIDLSSMDPGTGTLAVRARYAGARTPTSLRIQLYPGAECPVPADEPAEQMLSVPATGAGVQFANLTAGTSYILRGTALGRDDVTLASACAGPYRIEPDRSVTADLLFTDVPLRLASRYELSLDFDLTALAARTSPQWMSPVVAEVSRTGGDAALLGRAMIDGIVASAPTETRPAVQASLERAFRERLSDLLTRQLAARELSLTGAFGHLADVTEGSLAHARWTGLWRVPGDATTPSFESVTLSLDPGTPDVTRDDATLSLGADGRATLEHGVDDSVTARLDLLPAPYARMARVALGAVTARLGVASSAEYVALNVCPVVTAAFASYAGTCDGACMRQSCARPIIRLGDMFDAAVASSDSARSAVQASFTAQGRPSAGGLTLETASALALGAYREDAEAVVIANATLHAQTAAP